MMQAFCVSRPGGDFEPVKREIPEPPPGQVRIRVQACGVSYSDVFVKEGLWPGLRYPRIPGHEVVGTIDRIGAGVAGWKLGQSVGVGWHGGHCFSCSACRSGDFVNCRSGEITGLTRDGGWAQFMLARQEALLQLPEGLDPLHAAPLLCGGLCAFNALRDSGAVGADLVAVQGIGGLGHLAVQYAHALGFRTVAISRSREKEQAARELGADIFINSETHDPAATLAGMGGAKLILATSPDSRSVSPLVKGLSENGQLLVSAFSDVPLEVLPRDLIQGRKSVRGWPCGDACAGQKAVLFSARKSIRPRVEIFPLDRVAEAYQKTLANQVRFRAVLRIPQ